jgi:hypothetical protein
VLVALVGLAGTAGADPPEIFRDETTASSFNSCNGDSVELAGRSTIMRMVQGNSVIFHVTFHGQGTGQPSGSDYVLNLKDHVTFGPGSTVERYRANVISKGGEPNPITVIVYNNGYLKFETNCRG